MEILQTVLAWLDNPAAKYVLTLLGAYILKQKPDFPNKLIPVVTLVASIILTIAHNLFPNTSAAIAPAVARLGDGTVVLTSVMAVHASFWDTFVGGFVQSILRDVLAPWVAAIGTHSSVKNTFQKR